MAMLNILSNVSAAAESRDWYEALVSINPVTIVFTLINTLIIFLIFRFLLYKPVCKILDKRKEMAAAEISEAQKAKEAAQKAEEEYTARLAEAKNEAAEIVKQATLRAQKREEEIVSEANQKAADIRAKAEENIEREKQKAVNEIKDEISEMVVMAASKVVEKEISAKDNEALISKFLNEVESV
ncbi:MAG: F0F1 ATP synthase subunit B [Oscillospiraceae bacterium]